MPNIASAIFFAIIFQNRAIVKMSLVNNLLLKVK